jgi:hypothetical protein
MVMRHADGEQTGGIRGGRGHWTAGDATWGDTAQPERG